MLISNKMYMAVWKATDPDGLDGRKLDAVLAIQYLAHAMACRDGSESQRTSLKEMTKCLERALRGKQRVCLERTEAKDARHG